MTTRLQVKESEMMQRLRDAEHSQLVAEMRQRIAELEIKVRTLTPTVRASDVCAAYFVFAC